MAAATSSADGDGRPRRMSAATVATAESETRKSDSHLKDSFFFSYEAEGATHTRRGDYQKAIASYTKAIELRPTSGSTLVARGWCYLHLQQPRTSALLALHLEAEALHAKGLFEFALVAYHRAARLRPDMRNFQFGIQKCTDAIKKVRQKGWDGRLPTLHRWADMMVVTIIYKLMILVRKLIEYLNVHFRRCRCA
eukprot:1195830-Prorocentrum_minimum.AAC.3